jgi:hypothetical protein
MIDIYVKSVSDMENHFNRFVKGFKPNITETLWQEARLVMNESQDQCPVEFGVLKASGRVDDPVETEGKMSIAMSYSTNYAVYVHENLEAHHDPPTKAKFLEDPLRQALPDIPGNIVYRMNALITEGI